MKYTAKSPKPPQHFIHFAQPLFGREEKAEVSKALDSGWVTLGPRVKQFEDNVANYVGAKYAVGLNSCTAALHLAYIVAGVKAGDEVITTPFTFIATINPLLHIGAKPIFADIDEQTLNLDPKSVEAKITKKTKAIIVMDYGGNPVDFAAFKKISKKYNIPLIDDAACALGAEYKGKKVGSLADISCFSFHPIKSISTGDGGMITTNNRQMAERATLLRLQGMSRDAWKRYTATGSWLYDVVEPGYKYNMSDIQAAIGICQLKKLDGFLKTREKYVAMYDRAFGKIEEITTPYVAPNTRHARNIYTLRFDFKKLKITRDWLVDELKKRQIGVSVYYIPPYMFPYYKKHLKIKPSDVPVTHRVFESMLSLPLSPKMTQKDVTYIIDVVTYLIESNRA